MSGAADRDPGAPLDLYLLLGPAGEPALIEREVAPGAAILDLGCGTGRITNALAAAGRTVVAVDMDPRMLAHVRGAETVRSRIEDLALGRTFGGVLLMSNLVNTPDRTLRARLLATCRRHVAPDGVVLVERYDPRSGLDPDPPERRIGAVAIRTRGAAREGDRYSATVEYGVPDGRRWTVRIDRAPILDDATLEADLTGAGLRLERFADAPRRWAVARPMAQT